MIVQTFAAILILSGALIQNVIGTSYSNVYVESEVVPRGYYSYGAPYPPIVNTRLSQINSLPSVHGYVAPCVSPCVYPAQTVAAVTPINPNPNVLTYNAPNVPVVVTPTNQEAPGYEYSYVVYDKNTGDHKAQRELSDGSVVRGEYSFLQPDGYVREVQYVADDISGFNAVVRNFLPIAVEDKRKVEVQENKESAPPCHEPKNESLKEGTDENSGEITIKHLIKLHEHLHKKTSHEESAEKSKEHHDKSKESGEEDISKEQLHHIETQKEESGEKPEGDKHSKKESGEESEEKQHIKPNHSKEELKKESEENSKEAALHKKSKESAEESKEKHNIKSNKESKESGEETEDVPVSVESKEELKEKPGKKSSKETEESRENKSKKGSKEVSDEDLEEGSKEVSHGKHREVTELLKPSDEALIPYKDILKCIEAAMRRNYGVPAAMRQDPSPLTYIILNKPC